MFIRIVAIIAFISCGINAIVAFDYSYNSNGIALLIFTSSIGMIALSYYLYATIFLGNGINKSLKISQENKVLKRQIEQKKLKEELEK